MKNLSQIVLKLLESLEENLKTDDVDKWSFVVSKIKKGVIPKLKDLKDSSIQEFFETYIEIMADFIDIVKLLGLKSLASEIENFRRSIKVGKFHDGFEKEFLSFAKNNIVYFAIDKLKNEVLSEPPSKYNVLLAMRVFHDASKEIFILNRRSDLHKKANKLQVAYDTTLMKLYNIKSKSYF